ncbi:hypothetical protein MSAN_02205600 [Mycena sanguinolenta]|uniref:F-box domain-containing protein n=1 Tax=Mycena sanguinolenta TaxID=230812 RepID=A0A8H7CIE1_9AGAR|nr:hypothetical protein MSAN_02205600 [Mycena sanguinolenta]
MTAISDDWVLIFFSHHHLLLSPKFVAVRKMAGTRSRAYVPNLPSELWLYIQRLAVSDISPVTRAYTKEEVVKYSGAPHRPLNDKDFLRFLKTARSLQRVCRLWAELAQVLLYENVCVNDRRWPSLSKALLNPHPTSVIRNVRNVRLSPTRFDRNALILRHCGPHIEVLVQPEFPRTERFYSAALDTPLPPMLSLTHIYWIESAWSAALLQSVLAAAPNLTHLTLSSSASIGSGFSNTEPVAVFPPLPPLQSLVLLALDSPCVHALLHGANLSRLTDLTISPDQLESSNGAFPVLCSLRTLTLVNFPAVYRTRIPFPAILTLFPCLEELHYSTYSALPIPPQSEQAAGALRCVRMYTALPPAMREPEAREHLEEMRAHAAILLAPAFGALERVVLDGPGWVRDVELERAWMRLRARGVCGGGGRDALNSRGCRQLASGDLSVRSD